MNVKVRAARKFIEGGNKVKVTCRFRGREITHPEIAHKQLTYILENLDDIAHVEQSPAMEGRTMALTVAPRPAVMQRIANERAKREAEEEGSAEGSSASHSVPDNEAPAQPEDSA